MIENQCKLQEEVSEKIILSKENIKKLNEIVNDILQISEIRKIEVKKEKINLVELTNKVIAQFKIILERKNQRVQFDLFEEISEVIADEKEIFMVISNLLSNAIKYSEKNNRIVIDIIERKENIEFSITDYGSGIKREEQEKIFEKFYKETSLGLYICKNIIEKYNGKIWVESEVGIGSTFHFTLPKTHKSS